MYLVKKKRDDADADVGCTNCDAGSTCSEDCVCRYHISAANQNLTVHLLVIRFLITFNYIIF